MLDYSADIKKNLKYLEEVLNKYREPMNFFTLDYIKEDLLDYVLVHQMVQDLDRESKAK